MITDVCIDISTLDLDYASGNREERQACAVVSIPPIIM